MKKLLSILLLCLFIFLGSCVSKVLPHFVKFERFHLNYKPFDSTQISVDGTNYDKTIYGYIMGNLYSFEQINDNTILLKDSSLVALQTNNIHNFTGDFTVTIKSGSGINFYLRATKDKFKKNKDLRFTFSKDGTYFFENDRITKSFPGYQAKIEETHRIKITNDGKFTKVSIDCTDLENYVCYLPLSEFIILESQGSSTVELKGIDFFPNY